ncbi:hypothetical protein E2K93_06545 [Thalassotalea sp. HSM 43]|nr:lipoprotein [Thalassotalea sp. HSM 43]QBY04062.1 hypothetical protein E2K93_06545 [Thalassotalea sp. HSM 43]
MLNKKLLVIVLTSLTFTLAACGQKGPLYEEQPEASNKPQEQEQPEAKS